ncbi:MAG: cyclic nucleotide-binding protein [Gallionellales bacterium RIFCSPLOWO2_12_FULL_59_22]|nr:MAG: cyclic nucleotide-binding protein [Gallionellales bacterium RIFCSPLOWO2_02_FULL_59_110]OGT10770.1 MAG: cyclic nucleotide-binding protein [Gallionellales bacterium RIFCSPLOWO2_12_FULL_59_22]
MRIQKIEVARGIQWVEVPEANLRVLCGCPADAVKHLIKRGLILHREVGGVACETGPNAILLSDVLIQNGEFANLAEFPVLQMLYRQGMILPGHPNNTGNKPVLIGSAGQVESQMRYIYRGNYGLVAREEIIQAGISGEKADEMMRLKLKFAFGRIRPSSDFIDTRIVGDAAVEVANGVSLRRLRPNVFEFSCGGETVTVDLNLAVGVAYECAYPLGFRRFEPEYFAVIHSGEGDGWDVNRPSMSSIITYQGNLYLIDAGPHIVNTMAALGIGIDQVDGVFHTHAHDDHFAGLTALMRAGRRIRYFATPLVRASVEKKLAALLGVEEECFADFFEIQDLVFDVWNDVDGLEVMPVLSPHPVETNAFVFRTLWGEGYRSYAHFADIVSLSVLRGMVTDNPEIPGLDQQAFERTRAAYLVPVDLKKIDVGGGLAHGDAQDFREDTSTRILLAHRATELTLEEKGIGSSAAFGAVDVLIEGQLDSFRRHAFNHLQANLPGVPLHDLRMLVNHPVKEINPGAILLREDETPRELLLLLSGLVEKIRAGDNLFGSLSAGALIGDDAMPDNCPSRHTYRASSFVRALRLPVGLYAEVIRRNGLSDRVRRIAGMRTFLNATSLFGEGLPVALFGRIADAATERRFRPGEVVGGKDIQVLNIIRSGLVERAAGSKVLDVLGQRDFFGAEEAVLKVPSLFSLRVLEETITMQIPGELLQDVPILRWKLFEDHQQLAVRAVHGDDRSETFIWRDSFSIHVVQMDSHHKRLIGIANMIMKHLHGNSGRKTLSDAFDALVDYTRYHFAAEEKMLALYGYPGAGGHGRRHGEMIRQVDEYKERVLGGDTPDRAGFMNFMERWLVRHILDEDRKYGVFLNGRGVY